MTPTIDAGERESSATITRSIGSVVAGTYRLTRHIGSGGSSHVFEAEHVRLGKPFAVKLLRPELDPTRQTAQRFRREARAIARLSSEYIVNVVDCGELADLTPYLVMELLEGEDLRSLLRREGSLPARRAIPLIVEACRGLSEAHGAGLVHRDLKPENLFITRRATGEDWCKVLDFGVAKMDASMSTTQGAIVGTVRYMAPEQLADGATVGPATDIYALGAILYECLSGCAAHPGETIQEAMFSVLNKEPRALEDVPAPLEALVLECLSKDPAKRPRSARALEEMLSTALNARIGELAQQTLSEDAPAQALPLATRERVSRTQRLLVPVGLGAALSVSFLAFLSSRAPEIPVKAKPSAVVTTPLIEHRPAPATPAELQAAATTPTSTQGLSSAAPIAVKPRSARPHTAQHATEPGTAAEHKPAVGNLDPANPYSE